MKCPRCGETLTPSKKDPAYGLCYNCRKKYRLPKKKKKRRVLPVILILILCIAALGAAAYFYLEQSKNTEDEGPATKANPANASETQTVTNVDGTFSFKLDQAYLGDAATAKLTEMGEEMSDFPELEEGFQFVLLEYTVSADNGFEETPFHGADVVGNDLWDANLESKYQYYVRDLYQNADLDYYNLELAAGEESKMYEVLELPTDVTSFVTSISGVDRDYWYLYHLQ